MVRGFHPLEGCVTIVKAMKSLGIEGGPGKVLGGLARAGGPAKPWSAWELRGIPAERVEIGV